MDETNQKRKKIEKLAFPIQCIGEALNFLNKIDFNIGEVTFTCNKNDTQHSCNNDNNNNNIKNQTEKQLQQIESPNQSSLKFTSSLSTSKFKQKNNSQQIDKYNSKNQGKQLKLLKTNKINYDEYLENNSSLNDDDDDEDDDEEDDIDNDENDGEEDSKSNTDQDNTDDSSSNSNTDSHSPSSLNSPLSTLRKRVYSPFPSPSPSSTPLSNQSINLPLKKVRFTTTTSASTTTATSPISKIRKNDIFDLDDNQIKTTYKMLMEVVEKKSKKDCWLMNRDEMNLNQKKIFKNDGVYVEVRVCGNVFLEYVKGHNLVWYNNTSQDKELFLYPKAANSCENDPSCIDSDGHGHGYVISFLCNNRKCLNPNHLYCEDRLTKRDNCHSPKNNGVCNHSPKCLIKGIDQSFDIDNEDYDHNTEIQYEDESDL
ncbi:hypothetical protein ACTFIZ_004755 [Dictyostelium cf. discoideum]